MMVELDRVTAPPLQDLTLQFDAGVHVLLGGVSDGTEAFVELICGARAPARGKVRVLEGDPYRSPKARRRIGVLLPDEQLPEEGTVERSVTSALRLHGSGASAAEALSNLGLGSLRLRAPHSLNPSEHRAIALAIALHIDAGVLLLHEPLARIADVDRSELVMQLRERGRLGACVLCTTASTRDACDLSAAVWLLEAGQVTRRPAPARRELIPGAHIEFVVQVDDARRFGTRLSEDPRVLAVNWDEERAPGQLRVRGVDPSATARAIAEAAHAGQHAVTSLTQVLPPLDDVRAASHALSQAAYDQAYRTAQQYWSTSPSPQPPAPMLQTLPSTDAPSSHLAGGQSSPESPEPKP